MSAADILREAKRLLIVHGRSKDEWEDKDGKLCPLGAVGVASGGLPRNGWFPMVDDSPGWFLKRACQGLTVTAWNMNVSFDKVLDVFDKAILLALEAE